MENTSLNRDVILVQDQVLAAALFVRGHRALLAYQDTGYKFNCAFAITHRLRKDIRLYNSGNLAVDVRALNEELDEISMHLGDYECWVEAKCNDQYAKQK